MKKYNILFVNNFSTAHTGSPKVVLQIIKSLNRSKFVPYLVTNSQGPLIDKAKKNGAIAEVIDIKELSKETILPFIHSMIQNLFFLKRHKIDIVHVNYIGWRDSIVLMAKLLRIPIVLHAHNNPNPNSFKKSWNVLCANKIIAVSQATREFFGVDEKILKKSLVVHNGIDIDKFKDGESIRSEFKIDNMLVVGIVGQISKRKGVKYFIEMAEMVLKEVTGIRFLIVGKDAGGEEGYSDELKDYVENKNMQKYITFTGYRTDVENIMRSIDILTVPSLSEPFPLVVLEAMAARKCIVGAKVDGIPEAIVDRESGLLVKPKDAESLAIAVIELAKDVALRERMGDAAFNRVSNNFSQTTFSEKIKTLYMFLLENKSTKLFWRK